MTYMTYDTAEALIYDPVPVNLSATRTALYSLGFRRIEAVPTLDSFFIAIRKRPPDLAIAELHDACDELCTRIQDLRQGYSSYNPFIVILITAWEISNEMVRRVVKSGADDLILRPLSTAVLGARIEHHIERRSGFVVTSEYIGPDRRGEQGRRSSAQAFDPPNSLMMKAKGKLSSEDILLRLDCELRLARQQLNREKLRRDSFQMCVLWWMLRDASAASRTSVDVDKIVALARSISVRTQTLKEGLAGEWCDSIISSVEELKTGVDSKTSVNLLGQAILDLHQFFYPEKSNGEQISEIEATVALIRGHQRDAVTS